MISIREAGSSDPAPGRLGFVVCPSYHGSTVLALLLNNHSAVSALGDTNPTREYDQTCACGEKVSACPFWQEIRVATDSDRFAHLHTLLPNLPWPLGDLHLEGGVAPVSSSARVNRLAGKGAAAAADLLLRGVWRPGSRAVSDYVDTWQTFYDAVRRLHGTSLVVDGSKSARKVLLLARAFGGDQDVRVVHLVRDPRGFLASMRRYGADGDVRRYGWLWADLHERLAALESSVPYLRVRYEDLAQRPEQELDGIFEFLRIERQPVVAPPRFPEKHHLMGNAMLFDFDGSVVVDERWRSELTGEEQAAMLRAAGGTAARWGYA